MNFNNLLYTAIFVTPIDFAGSGNMHTRPALHLNKDFFCKSDALFLCLVGSLRSDPSWSDTYPLNSYVIIMGKPL